VIRRAVFALAALAASGVQAQTAFTPDPMGWEQTGVSPVEFQFIKPAPPAPPYVRRLVRSEGTTARTYGSFSFISMVSLVEFDCAAKKSRSLEGTLYSQNNISGDILRLTAPGSWRSYTPGSLNFDLIARVCAEGAK